MLVDHFIPYWYNLMWTMKWYGDAQSHLKSILKKNKHEANNVLDNLDTLFTSIIAGTRPEQLKKLRFARSEPSGLLAIDQRGPGKGSRMKELRLYVYPEESTSILHVLEFGDKSMQSKDIKHCQYTVAELKKAEEELLAETKGNSGKDADESEN